MKNLLITCLIFISCPLQAGSLQDLYQVTTNKNIYFDSNIKDLKTIPQSSKALDNTFTNHSKKSFDEYYTNYFAPWNQESSFEFESTSLEKEFAKRPKRYSESYQILPASFYLQLEQNANLAAMSSLQQKAIVINNTNLRVLPTNGYMFSNPNNPGEGYPFDYMQDDFLNIGEPLLISHYTKDGKFAYTLTSTGSCGFVLSKDLVEVSNKFIQAYRSTLVMLSSDVLGYLSSSNKSAGTTELHMGTILPLYKNKIILIPIKNAKGEADLQKITLDKKYFISKPLNFSKRNVSTVVDQLIDKPYGWGGNLFHMDCARLVRSYFAVFGIHMPLYSKEQGKKGRILNVATFDGISKKEAIIKYAIPYQSIIYLPGHIGVYLGAYNGEPIMLHAIWGLKLLDQDNTEYRFVIGKSIISTLSPGSELHGFVNNKSNLLTSVSVVSNL